uniref:Kinetochore protein SPC25 n=1 Tax=Hippocampus comes TaxID=109280 RepID=A0A3Q2XLZ6_HIPCM
MVSITDVSSTAVFAKERTEAQNRALKAIAELKDIYAELSHSHRQFLKLSRDECMKKFADDEILFETIEALKKGEFLSESSQEKQRIIAEITSEIEQKEMEKKSLIREFEKLQEEKNKTKERLESQYKANKDRLKNLQKARLIFEDNLGMEIRKIEGKLQFVFRSIDPDDRNSPYIITMELTKDGSYQTVSSKPTLECLPDLERKLQETKKIAVFLKNVRKQFISQACQEGMKKQGL